MSNKIWQSFGALNDSEHHKATVQDEFQEDLPFEAADGGLLDAKTPRRDFLKYLGFSTAAATLAASCETPVSKAIPFVNRPENVIPGVANYYATTFTQDGDIQSLVAKVRDGRPIKIEGNALSPINQGATSARAQASVLDLYETSRLRFPAQVKAGKAVEVSTFEAFDKMIMDSLTVVSGKPVVLLTSTITSPTSLQLAGEFLAKFPGSRHVVYDSVSYSGLLDANLASYGKRAIPSYQFNNANIIVSLGADFLGTWISPVEFAKQYSKGRKIDEKNIRLSKHYQFESILSMTGANADERYTHKPSEAGAVALALLNAINTGASGLADPALKAGIEKAAKELKANAGAGLVVSGSNDANVQQVVNAINEAIGANGKTINWALTSNFRQGNDRDMATLVNDMNAGTIGALFIYNVNPVYDYYAADKFKSGLAKVSLSVSFNSKLDETTELCRFVLPDHHYLESWGDAEPKTGIFSFIQPTIYPLFKTRQWQDSLLKWGGKTATATTTAAVDSTGAKAAVVSSGSTYHDFFRSYWMNKVGGQDAFDNVLRDGIIVPAELPVAGAAYNASALATATSAIGAAPKGGAWEVFLYEKVGIGNGSQASNPWLQELPDPITKGTWDNYAVISAAAAKELMDIDLTDNGDTDSYEALPKRKVLKITANGKEVFLPFVIVPGTQKNTIGIALGYGRGINAFVNDDATNDQQDLADKYKKTIGVAAIGAGVNVFPLVTFNGTSLAYTVPNATIEKTSKSYKVAQTQTHMTYTDNLGHKRVEVVKETSLATFKKYPEVFKKEKDDLVEDYAPKTGDYRNEGSLYDPRLNDRPGIHWGMSIDLNSCNGCGACVVSCNAENNIPVVGKSEVLRFHDMHWIRIDRYFVSKSAENPDDLTDVVFMPMLCQHCDSAPCENVCPVAATNHSSEGLNQMTYNRCIGTRYCANNCPYKVRRFNWSDYTGADSFPDNQVGIISDVTMNMNDDLVRMVLNPDVTVRSRGVIEKCTFCVQRLQEGKLNAKKQNRTVVDGEIKTACQSVCPSNAIVFGDHNDKSSLVRNTRDHSPLRLYYALDLIHTLPNVNYLGKIRNTDELEVVSPYHVEKGEATPAEKHG
ncbi:MAG: TAT-variant-translocated molybdopterin oxidoreductase [Bacteroidota bacterium]